MKSVPEAVATGSNLNPVATAPGTDRWTELPHGALPRAFEWIAVDQNDNGNAGGAQHVRPITGNDGDDETQQPDRTAYCRDLNGGALQCLQQCGNTLYRGKVLQTHC